MRSVVAKLDGVLAKGIEYLLVVCVSLLILLSVFAIFLRWFESSFHWIEPLVRHLVFLSAFLGGAIATGKGTHIAIDIFSKYLEMRKLFTVIANVKRFIALVSTISLVWMMKAGYSFYQFEAEASKEVLWGISSSQLVAIIPIGFAIIALRFFFQVFLIEEERH